MLHLVPSCLILAMKVMHVVLKHSLKVEKNSPKDKTSLALVRLPKSSHTAFNVGSATWSITKVLANNIYLNKIPKVGLERWLKG